MAAAREIEPAGGLHVLADAVALLVEAGEAELRRREARVGSALRPADRLGESFAARRGRRDSAARARIRRPALLAARACRSIGLSEAGESVDGRMTGRAGGCRCGRRPRRRRLLHDRSGDIAARRPLRQHRGRIEE